MIYIVIIIVLFAIIGAIIFLINVFAESDIDETKHNHFKMKEIPDIVYDIDNESKVVRTQEGFSDLFPICTLYRNINGKWCERAWTYDQTHHSKADIISYLLWQEKNTFIPKK